MKVACSWQEDSTPDRLERQFQAAKVKRHRWYVAFTHACSKGPCTFIGKDRVKSHAHRQESSKCAFLLSVVHKQVGLKLHNSSLKTRLDQGHTQAAHQTLRSGGMKQRFADASELGVACAE